MAGGRGVALPGGPPAKRVNGGKPAARRKVALLTAAGPEQQAGASSSGHGLFAYYVLRGLNGEADANNDATVTWLELVQYVGQRVANAAQRRSREQTPLSVAAGASNSAAVVRFGN